MDIACDKKLGNQFFELGASITDLSISTFLNTIVNEPNLADSPPHRSEGDLYEFDTLFFRPHR